MAGEAASRASLDLPGRQEELLKAVVALGKPVVLVLLNGRPLSISWAAENVPAILEAWEPGSEGGPAIADILFGDANPGGKLPVTFPRQRWPCAALLRTRTSRTSLKITQCTARATGTAQTTPLYPFGFGLSYTTFSITNLKVATSQVKLGSPVSVTADVTKHGPALWVTRWCSFTSTRSRQRLARPMRELKGFGTSHAQARGNEDGTLPAWTGRAGLLEHERR